MNTTSAGLKIVTVIFAIIGLIAVIALIGMGAMHSMMMGKMSVSALGHQLMSMCSAMMTGPRS